MKKEEQTIKEMETFHDLHECEKRLKEIRDKNKSLSVEEMGILGGLRGLITEIFKNHVEQSPIMGNLTSKKEY
ncbi:MAG: hypothetical protein ACTSP4_00805 [Candidatus Hodarchaeales archaeon]